MSGDKSKPALPKRGTRKHVWVIEVAWEDGMTLKCGPFVPYAAEVTKKEAIRFLRASRYGWHKWRIVKYVIYMDYSDGRDFDKDGYTYENEWKLWPSVASLQDKQKKQRPYNSDLATVMLEEGDYEGLANEVSRPNAPSVASLQEEVEQLRAALKEIASYHPVRNVADLRCIADAALKGDKQP